MLELNTRSATNSRMRRSLELIIGTVGLVIVLVDNSLAQPTCVYPRRDGVNPRVQAVASLVGGTFDYHYRVTNGPGASQVLVEFAVQVIATSDGLFQLSPSGWSAGGLIGISAFNVWDADDVGDGVGPGGSREGFRVVNAPLPAIVSFLAAGDVEPPKFPAGEAPDSCEGIDAVENSFKGLTIGPKSQPPSVDVSELLNSLTALVRESRRLGWIRKADEERELLKRLAHAKRALDVKELGTARKRLEQFVRTVREEACRSFRCRQDKALTSEAFALLFFNAQFLLENLPPPARRDDDSRDRD